MTTPADTIWEIEDHTQAKHEILHRYLSAWFPILGTTNSKIVYIDGFCGPGRYSGGRPGSPIIALETAIKYQSQLQQPEVMFLFMDERFDRIEHLKFELSKTQIPSNYYVYPKAGTFAIQFGNLLDDLDSKSLQIAPTFAFIDPFGFKGLPFSLVQRLLKNPKTEVFITVMTGAINRFLEHPDENTKQHIVELFGTNSALEIASSSTDRVAKLRTLYQEQLLTCAKFVRYFEMRDSNNRTIYYLFFATNHPLGHVKMKEAFWRVDPSSGFRFSDATNPNQLVLFEHEVTPILAEQLQRKFNGQKLYMKQVRVFVENQTAFLGSHMKRALKLLEETKKVQIETLKRGGTKRRANTYPDDCIVKFL